MIAPASGKCGSATSSLETQRGARSKFDDTEGVELMNSRREFLRSAAAGLTTALSARRVLGANDRLTGAFIGVGTMGTENLGVAMNQGVRIGSVCDVYQPHLERAGALARRQGNTPKEVKDFREILADRSIDF